MPGQSNLRDIDSLVCLMPGWEKNAEFQIPTYGNLLVLEVGNFPETHCLEVKRHVLKLDDTEWFPVRKSAREGC